MAKELILLFLFVIETTVLVDAFAEVRIVDGSDTKLSLSDISSGTPAIILGWGYNASGGVIHDNLQEADIFIFSDEECRNFHEEIIHPSHICAGLSEGGRGHCSRGIGAPLLVNGILVGTASWNVPPCAVLPLVYTQISYYREWIRLVTQV